MIRKRRKELQQAIHVSLKRMQGELLDQFPEMTALEVAKAVKAAAEQLAGQLALEDQQANAASAREMRRKLIDIGYRALAKSAILTREAQCKPWQGLIACGIVSAVESIHWIC